MANQRAAGQTFVGFWADESFFEKINAARGATPRSQWVRDVIGEELKRAGYAVSAVEKSAPDRAGKGGPKFSSKPAAARAKLLRQAAASVRKPGPK